MHLRTRFLYVIVMFTGFVLHAQAQSLPISVQRQGEAFVFQAEPTITGWRAALYHLQGTLLADSGPNATTQWQVPVKVEPGVYLVVVWLRGQGEAIKRLARLEVGAASANLQAAEEYLREVEPSSTADWGMPEYEAAVRRAYERGVAALPFFRTATKVLPEETAAYLLLAQAIRTKYAQSGALSLAPPPPPPPPPPPSASPRKQAAAKASPRKENGMKTEAPVRKQKAATTFATATKLPTEPTAAERQELLAATQKAVAVAKACAEKTAALQWLASVQGELEQRDAQISTLEQIATTSCATNDIKAQSWYTIGVIGWQCSYDVTTRYANQKRLAAEPFHYRAIANPTDQQRATRCLQQAFANIEKALTLQTDFAEAWSYRSLLYREKQKTTASPTEAQKFATAADEAARRAIELTRQKREK